MKTYPETKQEWWEFVDTNWDDLKNLIETFHPARKNAPQLEITAERAEVIRRVICKDIVELCDYEKLKQEKDDRLLDVFNQTYWGIPESTSSWNYNGFGLICDLCSEGYVLYEEE